MRKISTAKHILRGVALVLLFVGVASAAVMLLWNAVIPSVIGWGVVNYWQAAGLLILCRLLFLGFGHHRHHHPHHPFGRGRRGFGEHMDGGEVAEEMKGMSRSEKIDYIRNRMADYHADFHADKHHE